MNFVSGKMRTRIIIFLVMAAIAIAPGCRKSKDTVLHESQKSPGWIADLKSKDPSTVIGALDDMIENPPQAYTGDIYDTLKFLLFNDAFEIEIREKAAKVIMNLPIDTRDKLRPIVDRIEMLDTLRKTEYREVEPGSFLYSREIEEAGYIDLLSSSKLKIDQNEYRDILAGMDNDLKSFMTAARDAKKNAPDLMEMYYNCMDGFIRSMIIKSLADDTDKELDELFISALSDQFKRPNAMNPGTPGSPEYVYPAREYAADALTKRGYKIGRQGYDFEIISQPQQ